MTVRGKDVAQLASASFPFWSFTPRAFARRLVHPIFLSQGPQTTHTFFPRIFLKAKGQKIQDIEASY